MLNSSYRIWIWIGHLQSTFIATSKIEFHWSDICHNNCTTSFLQARMVVRSLFGHLCLLCLKISQWSKPICDIMISEMSAAAAAASEQNLDSGANKKSKKQPKGILKNSNPNATYHKHHHRRKLEELVAESSERPEIIPTHSHHSGRHKHHHEHHKHRSSTRYVNSNEYLCSVGYDATVLESIWNAFEQRVVADGVNLALKLHKDTWPRRNFHNERGGKSRCTLHEIIQKDSFILVGMHDYWSSF